ncbi:hypothetical protein ACIQU5_28035 [Streptomyces sp. NPDC090306]|uniref:hypothetical protein n=1 Tax=Streptomyces sp. NPDC090306 TaxID=3365961 RepID=UPI00380B423E
MSRNTWLRHPARTIPARLTCPTGEQRYATAAIANDMAGQLTSRWRTELVADPCTTCGGYHLSVRRDGRR